MKSEKSKNLLLINGFGSPMEIIDELLSNESGDSNIYLSYPLGILTLAAWCRQEFPNFNVQIVDAAMELHKQMSSPVKEAIDFSNLILHILKQIDRVPDFIGISFSFSNGHRACLRLSGICKQIWPNSKIIAGGVHATTFTKG